MLNKFRPTWMVESIYHITPEQIEKVCLLYGINFNWVFGTSDEVFNNKSNAQKVHKLV